MEKLKQIILIKLIFSGLIILSVLGYVKFEEMNARAENAESRIDQTEDSKPQTEFARKKEQSTPEEQALADIEKHLEAESQAKKARTKKRVLSDEEVLEGLLEDKPIESSGLQKTEILRYIEILERKKQEVVGTIAELNTRSDILNTLEKKIDEKVDYIDQEKQFILETLQNEKKVKQERLDSLIPLYEKMEPKKSAVIFEEMDKDLVVALFSKIKKKVVTKIIEQMNPKEAVRISEYFGKIRSTNEYEIMKQMNKTLKNAFDECKKS